MPVRPIRPSDIEKLKKDLLPDEVISAFNEIIAQNYHLGVSTFRQDEVVALMVAKGLKKEDIFAKHYLDIESLYNRWDVVYDKPGYNESYPPTFTFTKKEGC